MELRFGAHRSARPAEEQRQVERFVVRVQVVDYDVNAARHSAQIRATLRSQGQEIGPYDLMIAGHARSRGLVVVTGSHKEFDHVEGLRYEQ